MYVYHNCKAERELYIRIILKICWTDILTTTQPFDMSSPPFLLTGQPARTGLVVIRFEEPKVAFSDHPTGKVGSDDIVLHQDKTEAEESEIFFSFVRFKLQSPQWRWQYIVGLPGFYRACGLRECGLAGFPFWVACRGGRTAADVLLSDCQYHKGTALYGRCSVWAINLVMPWSALVQVVP